MLKKSFVFMMLLAASLIGIGSAVHHQPEVSKAQPQPQQPQQSPQQGQIQSPSTAPPTLGKRLTSPQGMQQQQQSNVGTLVQIQQDKELVNRLFPYIIQKIDGKTLAQKIDATTLLQKIDARALAAKLLPHLDVKVNAIERPGPRHNIDITGVAERRTIAKASCAPEEGLVAGGFYVTGNDNGGPLRSHKDSYFSPETKTFVVSPDTKTWAAEIVFDSDGSITTHAECLKVELALKEIPQPPPSQPPGGPPLQPPPGFGK
jgi:hypothetical protein